MSQGVFRDWQSQDTYAHPHWWAPLCVLTMWPVIHNERPLAGPWTDSHRWKTIQVSSPRMHQKVFKSWQIENSSTSTCKWITQIAFSPSILCFYFNGIKFTHFELFRLERGHSYVKWRDVRKHSGRRETYSLIWGSITGRSRLGVILQIAIWVLPHKLIWLIIKEGIQERDHFHVKSATKNSCVLALLKSI